ncbi:MAG TPA: twin-arginine translocation signal domain-containing protein, partial [Rhizobiales bacterium]|nr:twin-arginine translocation signal domain-containing protein [Hyphomicrobiales bacterium]
MARSLPPDLPRSSCLPPCCLAGICFAISWSLPAKSPDPLEYKESEMLNRRNFLKIGAAAPAAVMAGGVALSNAKQLSVYSGKDFSPKTGLQRKAV